MDGTDLLLLVVAIAVVVVVAAAIIIRVYFSHRWRYHQRVTGDLAKAATKESVNGQ